MVWPWPIRKRAPREGEPARVRDDAPTVHETPTREFAAHIPADEYSVHEKPTRELVAYTEPQSRAAAESAEAEASSSVTLEQSGPVSVRPTFEDERTPPRGVVTQPPTVRPRSR